MIKTRIFALQDLLNFSKPLSQIVSELKKFEWDSAEDLVFLRSSHIIIILHRYISNELSSADVEEWANAIEGREDVGFKPIALKEVIYKLANPLLTTQLNFHKAQELIVSLQELKE